MEGIPCNSSVPIFMIFVKDFFVASISFTI